MMCGHENKGYLAHGMTSLCAIESLILIGACVDAAGADQIEEERRFGGIR